MAHGMTGHKRWTDAEKDRVIQMRRAGLTWTEIGREFCVDRRAVRRAVESNFAIEHKKRIAESKGKGGSQYIEPWVDPTPDVPNWRDTRDITGRVFGDPVFERSALYKKMMNQR